MAENGPGPDEVISLEDLMEGDAASPGVAAASSSETTSPALSTEVKPQYNRGVAPSRPSEADLAKIDGLLDSVDPAFLKQLGDLKKEKFAELAVQGNELDDLIDLEKTGPETPPKPPRFSFKLNFRAAGGGFRSLRRSLIAGFRDGLTMLRSEVIPLLLGRSQKGATASLNLSKQLMQGGRRMIAQFAELPREAKLRIAFLCLLVCGFVVLVRRMQNGHLMPTMEIDFVPTVAVGADASWSYDADEPMEAFYSPLRFPEHVVVLDKVVVNIKPSENSGPLPMGAFEFYFEADSRDAAVELSDRKGEVLDAVQRTIQNVTYDEIVSQVGKQKLKLVIRKNVNTVLTKGRVRKVFYKAIVVKP